VEEGVNDGWDDPGQSNFARRWVDREIERAMRIAQTEGWLDVDDDGIVDRLADIVTESQPPPAVLRYAEQASIDAEILAGRLTPELQPDGSFRYVETDGAPES
jgi:hypothetical protein